MLGTAVLANIGFPLLPLHWAFFLLGLIPVVALEAWVYRRSLSSTWGRSTAGSLVANLVTTVLGVPVAWLASTLIAGLVVNIPPPPDAGLERLFADAVWLDAEFDDRPLFRVYPMAVALFMLPCLGLSVLIERPIVRRLLRAERGPARRAVWRAHLASYALLWGACLVWFVVVHSRPVGLLPKDARELADWIGTDLWESCGCGDELQRRHPSRYMIRSRGTSMFEARRYGVPIQGLDRERQQCVAEGVRGWLAERGLGPFWIEFQGATALLDREVVLDARPAEDR